MSLDNMISGDYGQEIQLTFKDTDTDAAADVSAYTSSQTMKFTLPSGTTTSKTAAFETDGSDGIISYTIEQGFLTPAGMWKIQGVVTSGDAQLSTVEKDFEVL